MQNTTEAIGRSRFLDGSSAGIPFPVLGPTSRVRIPSLGPEQGPNIHPVSVVELQELRRLSDLHDSPSPVSVAPYSVVDGLSVSKYINGLRSLRNSRFRGGNSGNREGPVAGGAGKGGRGGDELGIASAGAFEEPNEEGPEKRGPMTIVDFIELQDNIVREKSGERIFDNSRVHWRPLYLVFTQAIWDHLVTPYEAADMLATFHAGKEAESTFDHKLGIYNFLGMEIRANEMFSQAAHSGTPVTVAIIDLDKFKVINDINGHKIGDEVLKAVAKHWREHMRPEDVLARYGGEELAILLNMPISNALEIIELAQLTMTQAVEVELADKNIFIKQPVTASIGVAQTNTLRANMSSDELLEIYEEVQKHADDAMYVAKEYGRDRFIIYHDLSPSEIELAMRLRQKK